jgi:RNA polymerase sigma-70 factor (ECF subfamily)
MIVPFTAQEIATLVDAHFASLLLFVRQWEAVAPEDVVQDAFLQLLRHSRKKGKPDQPLAWLFRTARNEAITRFRKKQRREKHEQQLGRERSEWFEPNPAKNLQNEELAEALQALPGDQREIVVMRIWGELSFEEIAELTATPKTSVFRKYQESLNVLKKILE